jgi:hypothetical protein
MGSSGCNLTLNMVLDRVAPKSSADRRKDGAMTLLIREFEPQSTSHSALEIDRLREAEQLLIEEARRRQRRRQRFIAAVLSAVVIVVGIAYAMSSGATNEPSKTIPVNPVSLTSFPTCVASNLHASFSGQPQGAAGTFYYTLKVINHGSECTLSPLVVRGFNTSTTAYVGPWSRVYQTSQSKTSIASGHAAYVPVGVADTANYPSNLCRAASVNALRVALAGNRVVFGTVALRATVCTVTQSLHTQSASLNPSGV